MKVYSTHRMRDILPYTLPAFREGMKPELWLNRTQRILMSIGYVWLEGVIQSVMIKHDEAAVVVASRIKTKAATGTQIEIYRPRLTEQEWKLLDLEVEEEVLETGLSVPARRGRGVCPKRRCSHGQSTSRAVRVCKVCGVFTFRLPRTNPYV